MTNLTRRAVVCTLAALLAVTAVARLVRAQQLLDPTVAMLVDLIRIDTSNPPGREAAIAEYLAPKLKAAGFEVDVIQTPTPGKAVLIARLRGDGSKRPLLLAAHADVVGVEREKWSVDPFAGLIRDGYVFGRGAIDFKGGMAVFVRAAMMLAENKVPLARDVIVLAEADEEGGLAYSTPWLAANYWSKIDCEFALNEGGWIIKGRDGRVQYVSISTADKLSLPIVMTARGTSTHSSMPRPDSAIFALSRALAKLADYETDLKLLPSTRQFFQTLARTSSEPMATHFRNLTGSDPARVREADREISKDPLLHAIMRNTIAPVIMNAGFRSNVIPGSAEVTLNVRLVPGTDPMDMVGEIQRAIADPKIEVKLGGSSSVPPGLTASSENTDLMRALQSASRRQFPAAEVTPYLFQAATDASAWRSRGIPVYGIYPYPIDAEDLSRMHGNDERVSVESLKQGTQMIYQTLVDAAGRR
jgi:acetylornithine deacetylase/succinyl-diaminopimelate desuccinylase-like protein